MRYNEIKLVEDIINEIDMSPSNLSKLASGIDSNIGIEFEFVYNRGDDVEYTDKEDKDSGSFRNVENFFSDSEIEPDYASVDELMSKLEDEYSVWADTRVTEYMNDETNLNEIKNYILFPHFSEMMSEEIRDEIIQRAMDLTGESRNSEEVTRIAKIHRNFFPYSPNSEVLDYIKRQNEVDNTKSFKLYYEARKEKFNEIQKLIDKVVTEKSSKAWTVLVKQEIRDKNFNKPKFLDDVYPRMSDIYERFRDNDEIPELYWPQIKPEITIKDIEKLFKSYVGNNYTATTDSSISVESPDDIPLEIVTDGALPMEQALSELVKARDFIEEYGYTNDSTGLHINISLNSLKTDYIKNVDYVKLVLLLGDKYILQTFDRESNTYAAAAIETLLASASEADIEEALKDMRLNLNNIAGKILHDGYTRKYVSVNLHNNRVEFRSPGGEWLDKLNDLTDIIKRMIVALDASLDRTKYSKEYAKKLYKLLRPYTPEDDLTIIFAKYFSNVNTINVKRIKNMISNRTREQRGTRSNNNTVVPIGERYWVLAGKDLSYIWGSGKTKSETLENARPDIMDYIKDQQNDIKKLGKEISLQTLWNIELNNCGFFLTNKETHDEIQREGSTFSLKRVNGIYVRD